MKNVKSPEGIINVTGTLGDKSFILDPDDEGFFDEIEDGISSTVRCILDAGFRTVSSCEGHQHDLYQIRSVSISLTKSETVYWQYMISDLNIVNCFKYPITYHVLDRPSGDIDFMILIGSIYHMDELQKKQKALEDEIKLIRKKYYSVNERTFKDFSSKCSHINQFNS